jgi:S-formylglutathione hydrolase FrmB
MNAYKRKFFIFWLWLIIILNLTFSVRAQKAESKIQLPANVHDYKLNSKLMTREMPYRVVLPTNYNNSTEKNSYPVIYLLHGLTGHFDNWTDQSKLPEYAAKYNFIIVTPEGNNGWYTDSATVPNDKYESYIVQELIPEIDKNYRTLKDRNHRVIAGLSMGGYGSIKFGLKYPEMFSLVGSFSGALPAAAWSEKTFGSAWKALTDSITSVYAAENSPTRNANDIFKLVQAMPADAVKKLPFIYIDCGTEDGLIATNREFVKLLSDQKIPHEFRELPGAHNWKFWDAQVQEFLRVAEKRIK